jgi:hypothetical protein
MNDKEADLRKRPYRMRNLQSRDFSDLIRYLPFFEEGFHSMLILDRLAQNVFICPNGPHNIFGLIASDLLVSPPS